MVQLGVLTLALGLTLVPSVASAREVVVAIVDTGMDTGHPALSAHLWQNQLERDGQPGVDEDGNGYIDDIYGFNFVDRIGDAGHMTINDHGTHVAGLVLSGFGSSSLDIRLMVVNVFGSSTFASPVEALDEGIRYAARMGAEVINISATARGESASTALALGEAERLGSIVVAAAGNEGFNLDRVSAFPAAYSDRFESLITVAAIDVQSGALCGTSSFGSRSVWLAAPGCDGGAPRHGILSTRSGGLYGYKSGTSMAAPFVSGGLASWLASSRASLMANSEATVGGRAREWIARNVRKNPQLLGRVAVEGAMGSWTESIQSIQNGTAQTQ